MYNNLYERVKASYEYFIPYMSLNGQTVYADKALYDKFMSYGHMGVNLGEREDGSCSVWNRMRIIMCRHVSR